MIVTSSHIQLTLCCSECGHEWDIEDYDSTSIDTAVDSAQHETCPKCNTTCATRHPQ